MSNADLDFACLCGSPATPHTPERHRAEAAERKLAAREALVAKLREALLQLVEPSAPGIRMAPLPDLRYWWPNQAQDYKVEAHQICRRLIARAESIVRDATALPTDSSALDALLEAERKRVIAAAYEEAKVMLEQARAEERGAAMATIRKFLLYNSQREVSWHEVQDCLAAISARGAAKEKP
jgi:hypothetical protein